MLSARFRNNYGKKTSIVTKFVSFRNFTKKESLNNLEGGALIKLGGALRKLHH